MNTLVVLVVLAVVGLIVWRVVKSRSKKKASGSGGGGSGGGGGTNQPF